MKYHFSISTITINLVIVALIALSVFIGWYAFIRTAEASRPPRFEPVTLCHDAGGKKFEKITVSNEGQLNGHQRHEGDIIPMPEGGCPAEEEPVDVCENLKGDQATVPEGYTKDGDDCYPIEDPVDVCENLEGNQANVPEGYSKDGDNCYLTEEPKDYCDTLKGVQSEDEDCPPVDEPTCEELKNCPEVPPTGTQSGDERPKLSVSQGPNGVKGDGVCQLEWKEIEGSKKVEIRYANDGVFGNGYQSFTTDDDGAQWVNGITGKNALVKFRGRSDKTEWSKAVNFDC